MCPEESKGDMYENAQNSKILLYVLIANAIILAMMQTSILFEMSRFFGNMLSMMSGENPYKLELEGYLRIVSISQFPIALIYTSFPILIYLKLKGVRKTGRWSDMKTWFKLIGIFSFICAFGIFFFILIPFMEAPILLSLPFLATGIILLCSLKHIK